MTKPPNAQSKETTPATEPFGMLRKMHQQFGFYEIMAALPASRKADFIRFRVDCIREEVRELDAALETLDADGVVDAFADLAVFAMGALDLLGVDIGRAWFVVMSANLKKRAGAKVRDTSVDTFGMPELSKPDGWIAPCHDDNLGGVAEALWQK